MHRHGFTAITDLAELLGARTAFHGHRHEVRKYLYDGGCRWISVGMRQIINLVDNAYSKC